MGGELDPNEKSVEEVLASPLPEWQTSVEEDERPKSHVNKYLSCMKKSKILLFCQNLVIGYCCFTSLKNSHIRSFLSKVFRFKMFIGTKDTNFLWRNETVFWFLKRIFFQHLQLLSQGFNHCRNLWRPVSVILWIIVIVEFVVMDYIDWTRFFPKADHCFPGSRISQLPVQTMSSDVFFPEPKPAWDPDMCQSGKCHRQLLQGQ